jgi:RimJ/RimL family protein N-acetyltransferase
VIKLRNFIKLDIPTLLRIRNNKIIQKQLMVKNPTYNNKNDVRLWIKRRHIEKNTIFYIIAKKNTNKCIGFIQVINIDKMNRHGTLGIAIDTRYQGKKYGYNAILYLIEQLNQDNIIKKLIINVLENNINTIKLYKKHSFRESGLLKKYFKKNLNVLTMERVLNEK